MCVCVPIYTNTHIHIDYSTSSMGDHAPYIHIVLCDRVHDILHDDRTTEDVGSHCNLSQKEEKKDYWKMGRRSARMKDSLMNAWSLTSMEPVILMRLVSVQSITGLALLK